MTSYSGDRKVITLHNIAVAKGLGFLRPFWADYLFIFEPSKMAAHGVDTNKGRIYTYSDEIRLAVASEAYDYVAYRPVFASHAPVLSWDKARLFVFNTRFLFTTNQQFLAGMGYCQWGSVWNFVGFKLDGSSLYGCVRNGSAETLTGTYWTISEALYGLRVYFEPGVKATFYLHDGTSETSKEITTGLPSGSNYATRPFGFSLMTTANETKAFAPLSGLMAQIR